MKIDKKKNRNLTNPDHVNQEWNYWTIIKIFQTKK
jgi:hypothetical protein